MSETKIARLGGAACIRQAFLAAIIFMLIVFCFVGVVILSIILPLTESQRGYFWMGGLFVILVLLIAGVLV